MYSFGLRTHRPPQPLAAHLSLNYRFSKQLKHLVGRKITDQGLYTGVEVLAASGYSKDGDEEKASEGLGLSAKVLHIKCFSVSGFLGYFPWALRYKHFPSQL